jgi:predicted transcriptional regulator
MKFCFRRRQMHKAIDENVLSGGVTPPAMVAMVSEIVSAYVAGNTLPSSDLPGLIRRVHEAVSGLGEAPVAAAADLPQRPAVSIRKSVADDSVACLECGVRHKMLRRHLMTSHGLTPRDYRAKWALPNDYPLIAPNYSIQRSELAPKIGLGKRPRTQAASPAAGRRRTGGAAAVAGAPVASTSRRRGARRED